MNPQNTDIKDSKGRVTAYGFACGYIEQYKSESGKAEGISVTLWKEAGIFHVRQHDFDSHIRIFWESFRTLSKARKLYDKTVIKMRETNAKECAPKLADKTR